MLTSVEAFVLAVMTMIVVAIAVPSYVTIRDSDSDSAARSKLRPADEAAVSLKTYCLETTVRDRTWHLAAPAGELRRGGCR
jgi:hypothetical protein